MARTALVAGGTGLVGAALLRRLVQHPQYAEVRALGRRPPPLESPKLRFVASDFADLGALGAPLASLGLVGPLAKYRPVAADDVAAALVRYALADTRGVHVHHLPE